MKLAGDSQLLRLLCSTGNGKIQKNMVCFLDHESWISPRSLEFYLVLYFIIIPHMQIGGWPAVTFLGPIVSKPIGVILSSWAVFY